jgi:hypothetical protein
MRGGALVDMLPVEAAASDSAAAYTRELIAATPVPVGSPAPNQERTSP